MASTATDLAETLKGKVDEAPEGDEAARAAAITELIGGEAEAKALRDSLGTLCAELDRLLQTEEPEDTAEPAPEGKGHAADLRSIELDLESRRLAVECLSE
jgi:hypothetical protein